MKIWPELNAQGDLPAGIHPATLEEVIQRFGAATPQRQRVARRLRSIHALAAATGHLARFIIFGSFVTAKPEPNDVDIFLLMEDAFDVSQATRESKVVFDHTAAHDYLGASVFWIRRAAALGDEASAIAHWQIKRDGGRRGIVEVISHD